MTADVPVTQASFYVPVSPIKTTMITVTMPPSYLFIVFEKFPSILPSKRNIIALTAPSVHPVTIDVCYVVRAKLWFITTPASDTFEGIVAYAMFLYIASCIFFLSSIFPPFLFVGHVNYSTTLIKLVPLLQNVLKFFTITVFKIYACRRGFVFPFYKFRRKHYCRTSPHATSFPIFT